MNFDQFLIQNIFQEFDFSKNYFYLVQLDDENPRMIRNLNPTTIEDPLTYDGGPIIWVFIKKMKEALYMLIKEFGLKV